MSTWDKNGLKVKKIISETIKSDSGDSFLTKEVADGLYVSIGSGGDNGSNDGESYLVESVWNDNFDKVENSGTSTVLPLWSYKRIYSDGWVEQGGNVPYDGTTTTPKTHTITLLEPYRDIYYQVFTSMQNYTAAGYYPWVNNKTTTTFELYTSGTAGTRSEITWQACGYKN